MFGIRPDFASRLILPVIVLNAFLRNILKKALNYHFNPGIAN